MWGRELTPKRANEFWDSLNSTSQKKREEADDASLLEMKDEDKRENSVWRSWRWSSVLEWRCLASKKIRRE